jgi:catechol 2,3-dioxygenase-like lactoylglutathione lyase family enzyme
MPPTLEGFDHLHVLVSDRAAAVAWYARVLGWEPVAELASGAVDGGPLTLSDPQHRVHIALFEHTGHRSRATLALRVGAQELLAWRAHLAIHLGQAPALEDHQLSWSIYFADPDGNPYEITTYEVEAVKQAMTQAMGTGPA